MKLDPDKRSHRYIAWVLATTLIGLGMIFEHFPEKWQNRFVEWFDDRGSIWKD